MILQLVQATACRIRRHHRVQRPLIVRTSILLVEGGSDERLEDEETSQVDTEIAGVTTLTFCKQRIDVPVNLVVVPVPRFA